MPKLSIHIAAWNSLASLPDLFSSLENQTYKDFVVRVVDNGSSDGLEKWLREKYPQVMLIRNSHNLGFSAAHNQIIKYAIDKWRGDDLNSRYILVVSPDVVLSNECLEKLMAAAEINKKAGAFSPKILKMFQDGFGDEVLKEEIRSDIIDNTGLQPDRAGWFHKRGSNELDKGQYDGEDSKEIFGANNVVALYRAAALEQVKTGGWEYFDEDFYVYKEDADLAWRLQWAGWSASFVAVAVAHHARGSSESERRGFLAKITQRQKTQLKNFYYLRNYWWVLVKNLSLIDFCFFSFPIFLNGCSRLFYVLIFGSRNLLAFLQAVGGLPKMFKKRKESFAHHRVARKVLKLWFS